MVAGSVVHGGVVAGRVHGRVVDGGVVDGVLEMARFRSGNLLIEV